MIEYLRYYAGKGFKLFPCNSKEPLIQGGFKSASSDMKQLEEWWKKFPNANIGCACTEFQVLDVDDLGAESLLEFPPVPSCPEVQTPKGGSHYYFKPSEVKLKNAVGFRPGLDFRAINLGYVLLPPSKTSDGEYKWIHKLDTQIPETPEWLVELLRADLEPDFKDRLVVPDEIGEGGRNDTLFKWACRLRREGLSQPEIEATLEVYNQKHCKPPLPMHDIRVIAQSASKYLPEPIRVELVERPPEVARSGTLGSFKRTTPKTGCPSGFDVIDKNTICGGFPDGQMSVILADTKGGKSTFMLQSAYNIASVGIPVLFATFADLPGEDLYDRLRRQLTGWSKKPTGGDPLSAWEYAEAEIDGLPIDVYDASELIDGRDIRKFCSWCENNASRYGAIMVDYAQELVYDDKERSEYDDARKVSAELVWLAARLKTPVVIGSQMSEGNAKLGTRTITKGSRVWSHRAGLELHLLRLTPDEIQNVPEPEFRGYDNLSCLYLRYSRFGESDIRKYAIWSKEYVKFDEL